MKIRVALWRWVPALILASALAACGGGGESAATSGSSSELEGAAAKTVTLQGDVRFDSVPNTSGPLDYDNIVAKPARGVRVDILKAGTTTVLASTSTSSAGRYSVAVPAATKVAVRVWARLLKSSGTGRWDVAVRDNTRGNALYSMQTGAFSTGNAAKLERDVRATSGWTGSAYTKTRVAGPFAALDTVYAAIAKVRSVDPATEFPKLTLFWSVKNLPSSGDGDASIGEIGTTSFSQSESAIYVLGKANTDTDEYDPSVIAHEWGHYYQASFSRDDSVGGNHGEGDLLDRSVAFSEGWGNAWSGIALGRSTYNDSNGDAQEDGFSFSLSAKAASDPGWFNESSVQYVLWQFNQKVGFEAIDAAMRGPLRTGRAITSIHAFAAAVGKVAPSDAVALGKLLRAQSISGATNDAFGTLETNDGGLSLALPLYHVGTANAPPTDLCVSNVVGDYNKLGDRVYARITGLAGGTHVFKVRGPGGGVDPDFVVYQGKVSGRGRVGTGASETLTVKKMAAGEAIVAIYDYQDARSQTCFSLTID